MSTTITDALMTSDQTPHTARWSQRAAADGQGAWVVTWLPGRRLLTRDQAITAMTLAEVVATRDVSTDPWRLHVEGWAAELWITPKQAVELLTVVA